MFWEKNNPLKVRSSCKLFWHPLTCYYFFFDIRWIFRELDERGKDSFCNIWHFKYTLINIFPGAILVYVRAVTKITVSPLLPPTILHSVIIVMKGDWIPPSTQPPIFHLFLTNHTPYFEIMEVLPGRKVLLWWHITGQTWSCQFEFVYPSILTHIQAATKLKWHLFWYQMKKSLYFTFWYAETSRKMPVC